MRVLGAGQGHHCEAVRKRRQMLFEFVRRPAGGHEVDFVEVKTPVRSARYRQVAVVYRIERTSKKRNAARSVFCGGAVRLGSGQRGSSREATAIFARKCGLV